jgi:hypothetical protein
MAEYSAAIVFRVAGRDNSGGGRGANHRLKSAATTVRLKPVGADPRIPSCRYE